MTIPSRIVLFVALALLAPTVRAQVVSPHGAYVPVCGLPQYHEGTDAATQDDEQLRCSMFVPCIGVSGVTQFTFGAYGLVARTGTVGFAIYNEAGTSRLMSATRFYDTAAGFGVGFKVSGLAPFSLTAGTPYWLCWCFSPGSEGSLYAGESRSRVRDMAGEILNIRRTGLAANSCVNAVPPALPGAMSYVGGTPRLVPILLLGTDTP